jgi:hypothetical protein
VAGAHCSALKRQRDDAVIRLLMAALRIAALSIACCRCAYHLRPQSPAHLRAEELALVCGSACAAPNHQLASARAPLHAARSRRLASDRRPPALQTPAAMTAVLAQAGASVTSVQQLLAAQAAADALVAASAAVLAPSASTREAQQAAAAARVATGGAPPGMVWVDARGESLGPVQPMATCAEFTRRGLTVLGVGGSAAADAAAQRVRTAVCRCADGSGLRMPYQCTGPNCNSPTDAACAAFTHCCHDTTHAYFI